METAGTVALNNFELTRFFFAIVLLLVSAHVFGFIFKKFNMPRVIGEIFGGLLLGPTFLGKLSPSIHDWIFKAFQGETKLISIIYWFGLILLMFISGLEIPQTYSREDKRTILAIILGSTIIPFLAGWIAPQFYDFSQFLGVKSNLLALKIVIAVAVAVTSIPVLSKIFIDLKIIETQFAKIVLSAAMIHDVILWIALAIATGIVSSEIISLNTIFSSILITVLFFLVSIIIVPKIIKRLNVLKINLLIKSSFFGYVLAICFFFAATACLLNVNIVFGAFLAGIALRIMPRDKFESAKQHIKAFSLAFFIPIYFAVVGSKLDLVRQFDFLFFLGFLFFSSFFQIGGTLCAARIIKKDWLSSFNLSVAMNARGGPGIVLATVAFDMGIINEVLFSALVVTAIITSLFAGYWFKYILSRNWLLLS